MHCIIRWNTKIAFRFPPPRLLPSDLGLGKPGWPGGRKSSVRQADLFISPPRLRATSEGKRCEFAEKFLIVTSGWWLIASRLHVLLLLPQKSSRFNLLTLNRTPPPPASWTYDRKKERKKKRKKKKKVDEEGRRESGRTGTIRADFTAFGGRDGGTTERGEAEAPSSDSRGQRGSPGDCNISRGPVHGAQFAPWFTLFSAFSSAELWRNFIQPKDSSFHGRTMGNSAPFAREWIARPIHPFEQSLSVCPDFSTVFLG